MNKQAAQVGASNAVAADITLAAVNQLQYVNRELRAETRGVGALYNEETFKKA